MSASSTDSKNSISLSTFIPFQYSQSSSHSSHKFPRTRPSANSWSSVNSSRLWNLLRARAIGSRLTLYSLAQSLLAYDPLFFAPVRGRLRAWRRRRGRFFWSSFLRRGRKEWGFRFIQTFSDEFCIGRRIICIDNGRLTLFFRSCCFRFFLFERRVSLIDMCIHNSSRRSTFVAFLNPSLCIELFKSIGLLF